MDFVRRNARVLIVALLIIGLIVFLSVVNSDNDTNENTTSDASTSSEVDQPEQEQDEPSRVRPTINSALPEPSTESEVVVEENSLQITADPGDNQTEMARKVVAAYLASVEKELSPGQLLFMETNLVQDAGANDLIVVGTEINVDTERLAELTQQAENLSEQKIALWETYL